jgi:snRNA-activating protein complex subunit 3
LQENAVVGDLDLSIGARYLYCHEHCCEHFLYMTEIRMHNSAHDLPSVSDYPRLTQQAKMKRRKCGVCEVWSAEFVVYNDRLAATSPAFYCRHCHHMLHYTVDDTLLYDDFVVFPYLHDMK